jgi:hypothetical protein
MEEEELANRLITPCTISKCAIFNSTLWFTSYLPENETNVREPRSEILLIDFERIIHRKLAEPALIRPVGHLLPSCGREKARAAISPSCSSVQSWAPAFAGVTAAVEICALSPPAPSPVAQQWEKVPGRGDEGLVPRIAMPKEALIRPVGQFLPSCGREKTRAAISPSCQRKLASRSSGQSGTPAFAGVTGPGEWRRPQAPGSGRGGDGFTMSISSRHGRIHSYPILGTKSRRDRRNAGAHPLTPPSPPHAWGRGGRRGDGLVR